MSSYERDQTDNSGTDFNVPRTIHRYVGDIPTVSNEIELCLDGADAQVVIPAGQLRGLELDSEVNRHDIVELLVSMHPDVNALNLQLIYNATTLRDTVAGLDGDLYGGSSLLSSIVDREPAWYRTTSLSRNLADRLLDIASQQIILGIAHDPNGEQFGIDLYNQLRLITPVILAMSASSPFRYSNGSLENTRFQSRRIDQYLQATSSLPPGILATPHLASYQQYHALLQDISDSVNHRLSEGMLDSNDEELYRDRGENTYAPFDRLAPHQIYWMVRPRPDHANSNSVYSLELRVPDTPVRVARMQIINSFIIGLSCYCSRYGFEELSAITGSIALDESDSGALMSILHRVSHHGLATAIGRTGQKAEQYLRNLSALSLQGLQDRGMATEEFQQGINAILDCGNDATGIMTRVKEDHLTPQQLRSHLSSQLL